MRYELGTNDYGGVVHPRGHEHADAFVLDPMPTLTWEVAGRRVSRTVARLHGEPAVVLAYQLEGAEPATLEVRPLLAYREPGGRQRENASRPRRVHAVGAGRRGASRTREARPSPCAWPAPPGRATALLVSRVPLRAGRGGRAPTEDLFSPGLFRIVLRPGPMVAFAAWAGAIPLATDPLARLANERRRIARRSATPTKASCPICAAPPTPSWSTSPGRAAPIVSGVSRPA